VDSTLALGVNMSCPSANQVQARALDFEDSSTTGSAPNTGIPVCNAPLGGMRPIKGESFPPQSKSPSPVPFHRRWSMGRGRGVGREGGEVYIYTKQAKLNDKYVFFIIVFY